MNEYQDYTIEQLVTTAWINQNLEELGKMFRAAVKRTEEPEATLKEINGAASIAIQLAYIYCKKNNIQ